jgi:hypothetical protein
MSRGETAVDLHQRNRRVVRIILTGMAALIVASLLVGIRW